MNFVQGFGRNQFFLFNIVDSRGSKDIDVVPQVVCDIAVGL